MWFEHDENLTYFSTPIHSYEKKKLSLHAFQSKTDTKNVSFFHLEVAEQSIVVIK